MALIEVVKVVLPIKKDFMLVTLTEGTIRVDIGAIAAGDVIRHEIDNHFEPVLVAALHQLAELLDAPPRINRVIRTNVEIVFNRVRAARFSF